eukprot:gene5631-7777_t
MTEKRALLLGMVFAEEFSPKRGQEYRDRVRCEALEKLGYNVKTLDNKHTIEKAKVGCHCNASFTDVRRMLRSINDAWGENGEKVQFDEIILDYFFSPVGWARERWSEPLFTETIPTIAKDGLLSTSGRIWLPNLNCIKEMLDDNSALLSKYYSWKEVKNPLKNPLFMATNSKDIEHKLLLCPDALTNITQIKPLLWESQFPFIVMEVKKNLEEQASTSTSDRRVRRRQQYNDLSQISLARELDGETSFSLDLRRRKRVTRSSGNSNSSS